MNANRRPLQDVVREMLETAATLPEGVDPDTVRSWEVRLLCPRGHFSVNLAVIELRDDLVLLQPFGKDRELSGEGFSDLIESYPAQPPRSTPGWIKQSSGRIGVYSRAEIAVECVNKKCSYSGSFEYFALAREVRSAAAAGHTEYRLTD